MHHKAEEYLYVYIQAAGLSGEKSAPLWRKGVRGRSHQLQEKRITRFDVFGTIRRRARAAGISEEICCHTFRATGITVYRKGGGTLDSKRQKLPTSKPASGD